MNKLIFKNYFENINPRVVKKLMYEDDKIMYNYGVCVNAAKLKYGKKSQKYKMKVSAIQNEFIDHFIVKMFYEIQILKGKLCESLLKYHKKQNYLKSAFKLHFPKNYLLMYLYFTKKGVNKFSTSFGKKFYLKTKTEPYSFSLSEENKILINNIKCLT